MTTVRDIYNALFAFAPASMKMDWDNVGLLCGRFDAPVDTVLVALDPMPDVIGAAEYPENILENLKKDHKVYTVNATEEANKLGNSRVFNLIVLGIAAQHMDFTKEQWYEVIEKTVPPKTIEINKKAFDVGYHL